MNKVFFLAVTALLTFTAIGQTSRYWIATSPGVWSNASNWSTTQNGSPAGGVPASGDIAIFHGSDKGTCTIDVNVNLNKLETRSGFDEEIIGYASTITIGSGGLKHNAGTFKSLRSAVTVGGDLTITSDFIATTGLLVVSGDFLLDDTEHFDPAGGTVLFNAVTDNDITNNPQFFNVIFKGADPGTSTVTATQGFSVYQDLVIEEESGDIEFNGGTILLGGDLYPGTVWQRGSSEVALNGLGNQQLHITGTLELLDFKVEKLSGNVLCKGSLSIFGELSLNQGNILLGNSDVLTFETGSSVIGASEKSFVDGTIVKTGSIDFTFPCGSNSQYGPVKISNLSGSQDISCRYYSSSTPDQSEIDPPINFIDPCSYWTIEGTVSQTAKITFTPLDYRGCISTDNILHYEVLANTAGAWDDLSTSNTSFELVTNAMTPTGNYSLGVTTATICQENALYWVGTTSTSWNNALNWSKTSGGPGGYGIPCKSSTVIFDGGGNVDCDLSTNVEVAMALFRPDYTAEITTNGFQLRIKELFK